MKKIPLRKCLATNEQLPKKELIRVVRNKEGQVFVDPTGKMKSITRADITHDRFINFYGQVLKQIKEKSYFELTTHRFMVVAKKKKLLSRSLEVEIPDEIFEELKSYCD